MGTMISGTGDSGGCHIGVTSLISGTGGGGGCDTGVTFFYIALCRCQNASTGSVLEELSKRFRKSRMNSSVSRHFEHAWDRVCWHSRRSESMYGQSEGSPGGDKSGVLQASTGSVFEELSKCFRKFSHEFVRI